MFDSDAFRAHQQLFDDYLAGPAPPTEDTEPEQAAICAEHLIETQNNDDVQLLTNFTCTEFTQIWDLVASRITQLHHGGRHSRFTPMTWFMIALSWVKHGATFTFLSRQYGLSPARLATGIKQVVYEAAPILANAYIKWTSLEDLAAQQNLFENFPSAVCAVDGTVQQVHRNERTRQAYYSGKHHIACVKMQAVVQPNGMLAESTGPVPGCVHDLQLFRTSNLATRLKAWNTERVQRLPGATPIQALFDKGYVGVDYDNAVIPFKKPRQGELTEIQQRHNERVGADRILVERWFGRLKTCWRIMSGVFPPHTMDLLSDYGKYWQFCAALTNLHIRFHPLIDRDADHHARLGLGMGPPAAAVQPAAVQPAAVQPAAPVDAVPQAPAANGGRGRRRQRSRADDLSDSDDDVRVVVRRVEEPMDLERRRRRAPTVAEERQRARERGELPDERLRRSPELRARREVRVRRRRESPERRPSLAEDEYIDDLGIF